MNRPIKFRAWDVEKKKFIPKEVWLICNEPINGEQAVMIKDWENYKEGEHFYPENQVIMQFTGLLDKNGKEIYEGDMVRHDQYPTPLRVEWDWDQWGLFDGICNEASIGKNDIEVVGNIYQNKDLVLWQK